MRALWLVALVGCGDDLGQSSKPRLVAWYPMDDVSEAGASDIVGGHDATCAACPVLTTGASNGAYEFDGMQELAVPASKELELGTLTVSLWLHVDPSANQTGCALAKGAAWHVCVTQRRVEFDVTLGPAPIDSGRWHHISATYDGVVQRLQIDGKPAAEREAVLMSDAAGLVIGRNYVGRIDEVRIYEGVLDDAALAELTKP